MIEIAPGPDAVADLGRAMATAKASPTSTLIHVESDPLLAGPDGGGWWDVPVAETSTTPSVQQARAEYEEARQAQRPLLG